MTTGEVLRIVADDPMAVIDMPHFCTEAGHIMLSMTDAPDGQSYLIRKGA